MGDVREERRNRPVGPAPIRGWAAWAMWGLRVYIVVMLAIVVLVMVHTH